MKLKVIVVAVLVALILASCSNQAKTPSATTVSTQASGTTEAVSESDSKYPIVKEPIKVTFVGLSEIISGDPTKLTMMNRLRDITNIEIEWMLIAPEQLDVFLAAKDYPDVLYDRLTTDRIRMYGIEAGVFENWFDYLEYMPNYKHFLEVEPEARKIGTEVDGKMYGLVKMLKASTSVDTRFMIRTDYLEQIKMGMPETIDDFYEANKLVKEGGLVGSFAPMACEGLTVFNTRTEPFLFAAFGDLANTGWNDDGKGNVLHTAITDQYKRYLLYMKKLYKEGLFENEYLTIDQNTVVARTNEGNVFSGAMMQSISEKNFSDGIIHIDQVPPLVSEWTDVKKTKASNFFDIQGGALFETSKYKVEIAKLLDCWYSSEEIVPGSGIVRESFDYGIKGVDFDIIDGKLMQYLPEGTDLSHNEYLIKNVRPMRRIGWFDSMAVGGTGNSLARQLGYVKNNIPYQVPNFPRNYLKVTAEENSIIQMYDTEIESFIAESRGKFIAGLIDIESGWDAYVKQVKTLGYDEMRDVFQAAYDRWNK